MAVWKSICTRRSWGPSYEFNGKMFYGMPDPETLDAVSVTDLKTLGLAFRAEFLKKSTRAILDGEIDQGSLREMEYEEAHKALTALHGVGNKVADCVCLFSLGFLEAFPIDVWIERVIQDNYAIFTQTGKSYKNKSRAARAHFGQYAGYAQEFLFHYYRTQDNAC